MNQGSAECSQLIEETASVLDDSNLELLLVSTQQVSMEICIKYAQSKCVAPSKAMPMDEGTDTQSFRCLMQSIFECSSIKRRITSMKGTVLIMTPYDQEKILHWFPHMVVRMGLEYQLRQGIKCGCGFAESLIGF
jgi:hypothetical protein